MATKTLVSLEQFKALSEPEVGSYELDEGELVYVSPTNFEHDQIRGRLWRALVDLVENKGLGKLTVETGYELSPNVVRAPDLAFIPANRIHEIDPKKFVTVAPALAVEIFSPGNSLPDRSRKVNQYLAAGTRSVWVVYPDERVVCVFGQGGPKVLTHQDRLENRELLPGFSIAVSSLFE